jgi:NADH:ubiquinone oxidoreductase subunit E
LIDLTWTRTSARGCQGEIQELDAIIDKYKGQEGMVIRILQQAQNLFGYLPMEVQSHISDKLDIPISTINGIVSFYSLFSEKAQGKYIVEVCMGTACYVKGAQEVLNALKEEIKIDEGETSLDGLFTLKATRCIGACGLAPVMTINEEVYGRLTPDDIPGILRKYIKSHKETSKSR